MSHLSVQVRHKIKPHPNLSWRTWKGQEPYMVQHSKQPHWLEKLTHDLNRSSPAACSHVGTDYKNPVYLKPGSRRFIIIFYCSSTIVSFGCFWNSGLSEENSQCLHLREGSGLHELSVYHVWTQQPLDSSHSNDFHPKTHATILQNTTCTSAGFLHACENCRDTLGIGILKTIEEAVRYWH